MKFLNNKLFGLLVAATLFVSGSASATLIFNEDFDDFASTQDLLDAGWTIQDNVNLDIIDDGNGTVNLLVNTGGWSTSFATTPLFSLIGSTSTLFIDFDFFPYQASSATRLINIQYLSDTADWITVETVRGNWAQGRYTVSFDYGDLTQTAIRFTNNGNVQNRYVAFDNLTVRVPEPAALGLLGAALLAMRIFRKS